MEHIQQAIEKARKEREGHIGQSVEFKGGQPVKTNQTLVDYSSTKKIVFSDEELKSRKLFGGFAHDARSEPYRQLRSKILQKMRAENLQSLAITSPTAGNGKTLTALNLAIALSQEVNQTVLLVDLDLRNPSIAHTLGIEQVEQGIVECAYQKASLSDVLINPGFSRLVVLPGTPQGHQTSEILSSPTMNTLLHELHARYTDRLIIYDLPALLVSDDALVFVPEVDAVLLVLEDGGASEKELTQSMKLLEGANILGTVLNKQH